jgi:Spy/CpxP family protein refolding chaperone
MSEVSVGRKAFLWVSLVFLLGAALGGVLGYSFARKSAAPPAAQTDEAKRAHRVERLTKELGLNDTQKQQVDRIIAELQAQYKAIHDQSVPQIHEARQKARDEIRQILTADQKPKFEEFLKRLDEERKRSGRD